MVQQRQRQRDKADLLHFELNAGRNELIRRQDCVASRCHLYTYKLWSLPNLSTASRDIRGKLVTFG
jgi:hypothetical protein